MQDDWPVQHGKRDYGAYDHALNLIRSCFSALHVGIASEERWRWDTPTVTFTWLNGRDQISRNLNGFVLGSQRPEGIQIESNAWYDTRKNGQLVRFWRNFPVGQTESLDEKAISELVQQAYTEVTECHESDIENREILPRGE